LIGQPDQSIGVVVRQRVNQNRILHEIRNLFSRQIGARADRLLT
jgi:hypothetical protein